MREFRLWLVAVCKFVPAAIIMTVVAFAFYYLGPKPQERASNSGGHHYLDHFDDL